MKLRLFTLAAGLLFSTGQARAQSTPAPEGSTPLPWVANRSIGRGVGVRVGDFELHPGVSGEFGYDSNWYQRASSAVEAANAGRPEDALRFRVTPSLSLSTLDTRVQEGPGPKPLPRAVQFHLDASASYNELIGLDSASTVAQDRNISGNLGLKLELFRGRHWSGDLGAGYAYIYEPANVAGFIGANDRHVITGGGSIRWMPGGGSFTWDLVGYNTRLTLFPSTNFGAYDNGDHTITTAGQWRFLPKTALLYDASVGFIRYEDPRLNSGIDTTARVGVNGLLLTRLGVLLMGGWATGFRDNDNGRPRPYDDFVAKAELKYYLNAGSRLQAGSANVGVSSVAIGYDRSFENSYLGDFFQRDRGYGNFTMFLAGRWIFQLDGGASAIHYPEMNFDEAVIDSFGEIRVDGQAFVEYRPIRTLGINITARYDHNFSRVLEGANYSDDLSFSRFRGFLGVRWFL
jgi:hypothetical protein